MRVKRFGLALAWKSFATPTALGSNTFGYGWNYQRVATNESKDGFLVRLPHGWETNLMSDATAGVMECWLVLGPEKQIEVQRQPQGEQDAEQSVHGPGGSVTSTVVPSFTVDLAGLFAA